jgi:hypothetical protein
MGLIIWLLTHFQLTRWLIKINFLWMYNIKQDSFLTRYQLHVAPRFSKRGCRDQVMST